MALIEEHLRTRRTVAEDVAPPVRRVPRVTPPNDRPWSIGLLIAWVVGLPLAFVLEPAAAAETTPALWESIAAMALLTGLGATIGGLAADRPWAPNVSVVTSGIFAAGVIACPTTGHHAFGTWWIGELAVAMTLIGLSAIVAFRSTR